MILCVLFCTQVCFGNDIELQHFMSLIKGKHVLLLDDEQKNLIDYGTALQKWGGQVTPVLTLEEAKKAFAELKPGIILTDLDLRGRGKWKTKGLLGGLEFIEWVRQSDKEIPIMLHSTVFDTAWNRFWFKRARKKAESLNALVRAKNVTRQAFEMKES